MSPEQDAQRKYVLEALAGYWPKGADAIAQLPIPIIESPTTLPPTGVLVALPEWAEDIGVDGGIFVPTSVCQGAMPAWQHVDWMAAAFWYLDGTAERAWERNRPVHSYSNKLTDWDERFWSRAWVNRIALLLRRWAAHEAQQPVAVLCGRLPLPRLILSHDVDAIRKTMPIRLKQTAFNLFNVLRHLVKLHAGSAMRSLVRSIRFLCSRADYWCFDMITDLERQHQTRSHFNVHGGWAVDRGFRQWLFDPGYQPTEERFAAELKKLAADGWTIGLHPSFESWSAEGPIAAERERLSMAIGTDVTSCRQHWLRFSWQQTWRAQERAGIKLDSTLGFNDRPAFRVGAALQFRPWDHEKGGPMDLEVVPMILMDSQMYDYRETTPAERQAVMRYWLGELHAVHGTASVVWHQRVMSDDYGWADGYRDLLDIRKELGGWE
jgi:hypothetical protein